MKLRTGALLCSLCFLVLVHAHAATLPDSCGSDSTQFKVATKKGQPLPPADGTAQVVVIETSGYIAIGQKVTARVGLDGAWVGADNGNSYLAFPVAPGEHHLCANWQSSLGRWDKMVGLSSFTAEAGKTYYYQVKVTLDRDFQDFSLVALNDDQGKYMVQSSKRSISTAGK
ncbi:hypothetical protein [Acidicapsa ligni]|uniref:hypothetical protein n=1 Tax=Acidicapsa ligni TaxID=542300 RepID=UPI0021DF81E6|nr:hypothetical protein [Acidicapsa ligni]